MTIDKIRHYLGTNLVDFICALDRSNLLNMRSNLLADP